MVQVQLSPPPLFSTFLAPYFRSTCNLTSSSARGDGMRQARPTCGRWRSPTQMPATLNTTWTCSCERVTDSPFFFCASWHPIDIRFSSVFSPWAQSVVALTLSVVGAAMVTPVFVTLRGGAYFRVHKVSSAESLVPPATEKRDRERGSERGMQRHRERERERQLPQQSLRCYSFYSDEVHLRSIHFLRGTSCDSLNAVSI